MRDYAQEYEDLAEESRRLKRLAKMGILTADQHDRLAFVVSRMNCLEGCLNA